MVNKYVRIYTKRNIWLTFICATIVAVPLFITSLIYDVLQYDYLTALIPYAIAAVVVLCCSVPIFCFRSMILEQEALYGIYFNDADAKHLETTLYISQDWLIWAGISAFHKNHIKHIAHKKRHGRVGSSNEVKVVTVDSKKYTVWCLSSSNIQLIKEWLNN